MDDLEAAEPSQKRRQDEPRAFDNSTFVVAPIVVATIVVVKFVAALCGVVEAAFSAVVPFY